MCKGDGQSTSTPVPWSTIDEMLVQSNLLYGLSLPYYLIVSPEIEIKNQPIHEAVSRIETSKTRDEFLIIAYQDGGLITVSGAKLPFQNDAKKANWWWPMRWS